MTLRLNHDWDNFNAFLDAAEGRYGKDRVKTGVVNCSDRVWKALRVRYIPQDKHVGQDWALNTFDNLLFPAKLARILESSILSQPSNKAEERQPLLKSKVESPKCANPNVGSQGQSSDRISSLDTMVAPKTKNVFLCCSCFNTANTKD